MSAIEYHVPAPGKSTYACKNTTFNRNYIFIHGLHLLLTTNQGEVQQISVLLGYLNPGSQADH